MTKVSVIVPVYNVENYIRDMLLSVQNQTFKDFEVILINDGSTDNSQDIIEEFCRADKRFKCYVQENGGVAAARNNGLAMATGDYVIFYDPDDYIPKNAIKKLYSAVLKNDADMAVGVMRERRPGECRYNASTIRLGRKKIIDKYDKDLLWSFSVCNKIFNRKMIIENGFSFEKLKHAEDALFLFNCIFAAKKIAGCNACVYEYKFRPFWESKSATQMMKKSYLEDVIIALDKIEVIISKNISSINNEEYKMPKEFLDEFYIRYLDISLFVGYYRQFWMMEDGCLDIIKQKVLQIRNKISSQAWVKVSKKNRDLQLEKDIYDSQKLIDNALLTFVINSNVSEDNISLLINSIYDQAMPSFKVILPISCREMIMNKKLYRDNMFFEDVHSIKNIDTNFVMYVDERFVFSKNSIRIMINSMLNNDDVDFTTAPIKTLREGNLLDTEQVAAFTALQCINNTPTKYNELDYYIGNKIFRIDRIADDFLSNDTFEYGNLSYKKLHNAYMIAIGNLEKKRGKCLSGFGISLKSKQKSIEDKLIEMVKNHFTKEDLRKVIKRL